MLAMGHVFAIAVGGAAGTVCRYAVSCACLRWMGTYFAYGTLAVNVTGCFLVGLLIESRVATTARWEDVTHSELIVGFLGALTTFSAFGLETARFFQNAQHALGLINIAGNMLLGLTAVYGDVQMARWIIS